MPAGRAQKQIVIIKLHVFDHSLSKHSFGIGLHSLQGVGLSSRSSRLLSYMVVSGSSLSYQYQYESPHLIPSNVPEVIVFFKTKVRFDISITSIKSRYYIAIL